FDQRPPHAMRSVDESGVIYLGSFSKTFAPGLRVGWALAPHAIREKLILANEAAVLSPSSFSQYIVAADPGHHEGRTQIVIYSCLHRERRDAPLSARQEHLPKLSWTPAGRGFYVWRTLPEHIDPQAMLPRAVKELVAYTP